LHYFGQCSYLAGGVVVATLSPLGRLGENLVCPFSAEERWRRSRRSLRGGFIPFSIFVRPSSGLVGLLAGDEQGVGGPCRLDVGSCLSLGVVVLVVVALFFQLA
jgi:hypothetical protein